MAEIAIAPVIGLAFNVLKNGFDIYSSVGSKVSQAKSLARDEAKSKLESDHDAWDVYCCNKCGTHVAHTVCNNLDVYWSPELGSVVVHKNKKSCHSCKFYRPKEQAGEFLNMHIDRRTSGKVASIIVSRFNLKEKDIPKTPRTPVALGKALHFHDILLEVYADYYRSVISCINVGYEQTKDREETIYGVKAIINREIEERSNSAIHDCVSAKCEDLLSKLEDMVGIDGNAKIDDLDNVIREVTEFLPHCGCKDVLCMLKRRRRMSLWDYLSKGRLVKLCPDVKYNEHGWGEMVEFLRCRVKPMNIKNVMRAKRFGISSFAGLAISLMAMGKSIDQIEEYIDCKCSTLEVALDKSDNMIHHNFNRRSTVTIDDRRFPFFTGSIGTADLCSNPTQDINTDTLTEVEMTVSWNKDKGLELSQGTEKLHLYDMIAPGNCCNGNLLLPWMGAKDSRPRSDCWSLLCGDNLMNERKAEVQKYMKNSIVLMPAPLAETLIKAGYAECSDEKLSLSVHIKDKPTDAFSFKVKAITGNWYMMCTCG